MTLSNRKKTQICKTSDFINPVVDFLSSLLVLKCWAKFSEKLIEKMNKLHEVELLDES